MSDLARSILDLAKTAEGARVVYGMATATNTVKLEGVATAVMLPALSPVVAGNYCAVLVQGADRLILGAVNPTPTPTPWINATLLNGWSNYGGTYQSVQYRKVGDIVSLRGLMKGGISGSVPLILPVGYRPPAILLFAADKADLAHGRLDVMWDGHVVATWVAGTSAYFSVAASWSITP